MKATDEQVSEAIALCARIKPLLGGHGPGVQGAVIAELLACFLAGHHEMVREKVLELHIKCVRDMVAPCLAELRSKGFPR